MRKWDDNLSCLRTFTEKRWQWNFLFFLSHVSDFYIFRDSITLPNSCVPAKVALLLSTVYAQGPLPCVACAQENKPICAQPANGGKPETFQSHCLMLAQDCGHSEHRK